MNLSNVGCSGGGEVGTKRGGFGGVIHAGLPIDERAIDVERDRFDGLPVDLTLSTHFVLRWLLERLKIATSGGISMMDTKTLMYVSCLMLLISLESRLFCNAIVVLYT